MSDVGIIWARAPSLERLEKQLARLLADRAPDDVLAISHTTTTVAGKTSGAIWAGARHANTIEYSAVVLVRE